MGKLIQMDRPITIPDSPNDLSDELFVVTDCVDPCGPLPTGVRVTLYGLGLYRAGTADWSRRPGARSWPLFPGRSSSQPPDAVSARRRVAGSRPRVQTTGVMGATRPPDPRS
jgi:hypothetical protein